VFQRQLSKEGLQNVVNAEEEKNKFSTKDLKVRNSTKRGDLRCRGGFICFCNVDDDSEFFFISSVFFLVYFFQCHYKA
jgi:hypothetical protein